MRRASISTLKATLSKYLDAVRRGEEVLITDRGRPIARILPVTGDEEEEGRLSRLIREGILSPPLKPRSGTLKPPSGRRSAGVLAALLDEREEGW